MKGPDFILAGGHKCATTSIHRMLDGHPEIDMSTVKEPHYFVRDALGTRVTGVVSDREEYESLWQQAAGLRGEASVLYLPFAGEAARRMQAELDHTPRIVVSVRNPIERARSSYLDVRLKNPDETAPNFEAAVEREFARGPWRLDGAESPTLRHLALGRYADGIAIYDDAFGRENVHVVVFDDFLHDAATVLEGVQRFLGVGVERLASDDRLNQGGVVWRSVAVSRLMRSRAAVRSRRFLRIVAPRLHGRLSGLARQRLSTPAPALSARLTRRLWELYADEVARLEKRLERSLQHWRPAG